MNNALVHIRQNQSFFADQQSKKFIKKVFAPLQTLCFQTDCKPHGTGCLPQPESTLRCCCCPSLSKWLGKTNQWHL